jgi:hypothetical protein
MRLGFPNGEHEDRIMQGGELRIGSAADNDIVLGGAGVEPHHAALTLDTRGAILWLLSAEATAYVNARPVRERAMLRLGDSVTLGETRFVLKADQDSHVVPAAGSALPSLDSQAQARQSTAPARAVLRGLSGPLSGQVVPVRDRLVIGSGESASVRLEDATLPEQGWSVECDGQRLQIRALDPQARAEVNGIPVREASLHQGDQVAFGNIRFLVEAPGLLPRTLSRPGTDREVPNVTQTMRAVRIDEAGRAESGRARAGSSLNIWLLIAAAGLVAGVIAALLLIEF